MEGHLQLQRALLIEGEGIKVKPNEWDALATKRKQERIVVMEMDRRVACAAAIMLYNKLRGAAKASRMRQRRLHRVAALLYEQEVISILNCNSVFDVFCYRSDKH